MAGRPARRAYRMTARRRAALRKAQLASARKRKRNRNLKKAAYIGGGVAALGLAAYAGTKLGGNGGIAKDLRGRKLSMNSMKNAAVARLATHPAVKEAVMKANAVSPPTKAMAQPTPLITNDPVASAPKNNSASKPNTKPADKPDVVPPGGGSVKKPDGNMPAAPGMSKPVRQPTVSEIKAQTAEDGRTNAANQPWVNRQGKEVKDRGNPWIADQPVQDVWGAPAGFTPYSTDKIISMLPGGRVNKTNVKKALNQMAREAANMGHPLSKEQVTALKRFYGNKFQLDLS